MKYILILVLLVIVSCNTKELTLIDDKVKFCNQSIDINEKAISCINSSNIDLVPLLKLKKIELLDLSGSKINNFSTLSSIKSLKYLLLTNTNFNDSKILSSLVNLEEIFLSNTKIKSINFLKKLKNVRVLYIDNTLVTNIDILKKYPDSCEVEFNLSNMNVNNKKLISMFLKYKKYYGYKDQIKIEQYYSKSKIYGVKTDITRVIDDSCKDKDYRFLKKYKDFRLSLYYIAKKKLRRINLFKGRAKTISYEYNENYWSLKYLMFLKHFNKLEFLMLHLNSNKQFSVVEALNYLKKLYLSGSIGEISKLTKSLEHLSLYNTGTTNFNFLDNSQIKNLEVITHNPKSIFWKKLIKKHQNINIKVFDNIFFTLTIYDSLGSENQRLIDCSSVKYGKDDLIRRNRDIEDKRLNFLSLNQVITSPKYYGAFIDVNYEQYKSILELRELIVDKDWEYLILTNNYTLINYLLRNYDFNLNKLGVNNKTILDNVINDADIKIIDLIKRYGAKRACEILKNKCGDK